MNKPKTLMWDIETAYMIAEVFSLYPDAIAPAQILKDWYVFCGSWKWEGTKKVEGVSLLDTPKLFKKDKSNDYHVIKTLHSVLKDADCLVAHNGDKFDLKKFNTRAIFHGLDPLPHIKTIDTLKIAKKYFKFSSNRLDYLAKFLGYKGKLTTPAGLWRSCMEGDESSLKHMLRYNKVDIQLLEFVYKKFKPFLRQADRLNKNLFGGKGCPSCGSSKIYGNGTRTTLTRVYRRFRCDDCGAHCSRSIAEKDIKSEIK